MSRVDWKSLDAVWKKMPDIEAAWAFGSSQGGVVREGGDFDIGVFFRQRPSLDSLAELRALLQSATNIDEIDLVVLNDGSPVLRFEAISGLRLFCRDKARCAECVSLWAREYEDQMTLLEKSIRLRSSKDNPNSRGSEVQGSGLVKVNKRKPTLNPDFIGKH